MKHFFLLILTIGALSVQAQKIGYVNVQEIFSLLPEVKEVNTEIETMKTMYSKKGEDMIKSFQMKYQDLQQKQQSGQLAPIEIEKQAASLKEEENKIVEFEQTSQQEIYAKTQEMLKPIQDKLNQAIQEVAKENQYLYIMDTSLGMILYADPTGDATTLVKTKLGIAL